MGDEGWYFVLILFFSHHCRGTPYPGNSLPLKVQIVLMFTLLRCQSSVLELGSTLIPPFCVERNDWGSWEEGAWGSWEEGAWGSWEEGAWISEVPGGGTAKAAWPYKFDHWSSCPLTLYANMAHLG